VLIISAVEHPAVRAGGRFPVGKIEMIPVDHAGVVDFAALELMLARHQAKGQRALVSVMAANNETGVIEPCTKIAELVHAAGGIFHTDAVQIAGRIPFDLAVSGADLISLSSHKLGGPQGVGALIARDEAIRVPAMLRGGGQERGRRAGTENVAAIVGFGIAAECAALVVAEETGRLAGLRDRLEQGIRAVTPDAIFLSAAVARLPNTTCFAVPGIAAETAVIAFDLEGIAVSAGAACSSGKVGPSEALAAMRVPSEIAKGAVRVSLGWSTSESDISRFLLVWKNIRSNLSQRRRERAA
jgi:cysteine desulfurase